MLETELKIEFKTTKTIYWYIALWLPKLVEKLFPDKTLMIVEYSIEGGKKISLGEYSYNSITK